jgi:hypothetical protein
MATSSTQTTVTTTPANAAAAQSLTDLVGLAQTLAAFLSEAQAIIQQYNVDGLAAIFAGMNTTALNADGTLGTPDVTPVSGHVIDTRYYSGVNFPVAATTLAAIVSMVNDVNTYLGGAAGVAQNSEAPALIGQFAIPGHTINFG